MGQRGYTPYKKEHAKDNPHPDLKEFWHVGRELEKNSPYYKIYPPNVWPREIPQFKMALLELYQAMDKTAVLLLQAIAEGLDLPKEYFLDMVKDGNSILRAIYYRATQGENTKDSIRASAHEDINLITLLVGATSNGLQLLDHNGKWLDIEASEGQIVVDTGDMMARITNGVLPATTHRVVNPEDADSVRYSMPYFVHPHSEAILSCIATCLGDGAQFPDIKAHDFLKQRLKEIGLYKDGQDK